MPPQPASATGAAAVAWPAAVLAALLPAAAPAAGPPGSGGLPQLDTSTYVSQLFWLAVFFGILYLVVARLVLPGIGRVAGERATAIRNDLAEAERLGAESAAMVAACEERLAEARERAHGELTRAMGQIAAMTAESEARSELQVKERLAEAQLAIAAATGRARDSLAGDAATGKTMDSLAVAAGEIAIDLAQRVAPGLSPGGPFCAERAQALSREITSGAAAERG